MAASRPLPVRFHPAVEEWFAGAFAAPTRAQELAWPEIHAGHSTLVLAPTGSGKTLAAFLAAIDRLMFAPVASRQERCRVLYVSPLRALAVDVERNLRAPLAGIARIAERRGDAFHLPAPAIRSGDTKASERARMARQPPDVLITTPESLFLILSSRAREMLASVEVAIVDEIHVLVGTKRGAHLALSLERVAELARRPLQRIGLSATQRPLDEVARYLGGGEGTRTWKARPVRVVDAGIRKAFDLRVEVPVEDLSKPDALPAERLTAMGAGAPETRRSIWPAVHPRLLELIRAHRSTILFVNSRRLAERLAAALNELAGEDLVRAHHGSIARDERVVIEEALKAGRLPAMIATSSLELGIDMGAVDLVVQIETPPSIASGMQRIGRASHQAGAVSRGVIFPKFRGDLLATAAVARAMLDGAVEATRIPGNPLDVLAQQLVSMVAARERSVDELFALARRAAPFRQLPRPLLEGVLDMLCGRYPSDEFAELRPRLTWDRRRDLLRAREGAARLVVANAGTIPDRGLFGVFLAEGEAAAGAAKARPGRRVGELDEEMVFESREGEVFVLGASSWRIAEIGRDRVLVTPAPGEPGKLPFWRADRPPRPVEFGRAIGRLTRVLAAAPRLEARQRLIEQHALTPTAADNLLAYLEEQRQAAGVVPDDRTLVLERGRDELGDWRLCLLSPFGGRVHAPWALALQASLRASGHGEVEAVWGDDGIVVRLPDRERPPDAAALLPAANLIEDLLLHELPGTPLFAARFREAAARALLLPRRRPGQRTPLWMQRKRAHDLLAVASRFGSFPIVLEAMRECLQDVFDVPGLVELARGVERRELRLVTVDTSSPSPFAASLLFGYVANYLYDGDAPLAERRAQALSVDQGQLRELLGQSELRELLDAAAIEETEAGLQGLGPGRGAKHPDRLHDLLLRLGDLSFEEIALRVTPPPEEGTPRPAPAARAAVARQWLDALASEQRVIPVRIAGEQRFAAAEDAGRLRDALGTTLPAGLPQAFLAPAASALDQLVSRYARTHGPFAAAEAARRYGQDESAFEEALERLAQAGRVLEGEFRPGRHGREWCDPGVLATVRRRSLARLRKQVEPVEPAALARFLLDWHLVTGAPASVTRSGPDALLDVVERIQGAPVPASTLEGDLLPARLGSYRPQDLDVLCAAGELAWVGVAPLGERDGRVALYLADALERLHTPAENPPRGELHDRLRDRLAGHGASFFADLHAACGGLARDALSALWDLVWSGEVTNDTPEALRAFLRPESSRSAGRRGPGSFRSRRALPPAAVGRWSLLARRPRPPGATERLKSVAEQLLVRHGVLTRGAVVAEGVPGGFAALYPVLSALEDAGRVRRGYFVTGLGGSQFALPAAVERLRALKEPFLASDSEAAPDAIVLSSTDPANPYGAALPWPDPLAGKAMRAAGTHVVLADGRPLAFITRGQREIALALPDPEPERSPTARALAGALARWSAQGGRRALGWAEVDGGPIAHSVLAPFLLESGFVPSGPGLRLDAAPSPPEPAEDQ